MGSRQTPLIPATDALSPWRRVMPVVLAVSAVLRLLLVRQGGQMMWSDESRYRVARDAAAHLAAQEYGACFRLLLGGADHLLFKVIGLLPAGVEQWMGRSDDRIPAAFFAVFSVFNIYLVGRLARAAGAGIREAVVAALLLALSTTHFYYARHLFPYDLSLTFGLLAMGVAWSGEGWRRSLAGGVLAGCGFLAYNGAWLFGAMVLIGHVLFAWPDRRRLVGRAGWAGAGLLLPIVMVIGLARLAGADLVESFVSFSHTVNQGDFGRGWKLVIEYFWAAEGPVAVVGLAALIWVGAGGRGARNWHRGFRWAAGAGFLGVGLLLFSDVWPKFVIYGRTVRFMVPLVCLATAYGLEGLWRQGGRPARLAAGVLVFVLGQAAANFWIPIQQVFPPAFTREARRLKEELRGQGEQRQLVVINADMLVGQASLLEGLPDHDEMLVEPNPLQFRPYLFEGFNEETRHLLDSRDIRMQLIAVNQARFDYPAELQQPYPGVVRLTLRLPDVRVPGLPEPLLVTGDTGKGDFIYLVYQADNSIRLGFDHWNYPGKVSEPVPVDPAQPVVITLSMGPLHGPEADAADGSAQVAPDPHHWLYVAVNDQMVWSHPADFHAAPPDSISFLKNYIGGSTAGQKFTGKVLSIQSLRLLPFEAQKGEIR